MEALASAAEKQTEHTMWECSLSGATQAPSSPKQQGLVGAVAMP